MLGLREAGCLRERAVIFIDEQTSPRPKPWNGIDMLRWISASALALFLLIPVSGVALAEEYNFEKHASKKGCASIVFPSRRSDCESKQRNKNDACRKALSCDYRKAQSVLEVYKESMKKRTSANDSDKAALERKISELKSTLDAMKALGSRGVPLAEACVRARAEMKKIFAGTVSLTKDAGSNALRNRQKLLDSLKDARKNEAEAKAAKDKAERGDNGPKRKWEDAQKEVRRIEKELERFNYANGKDIQRNVDRLMRHYEEGRKEHEQPERDDQNRLDNCKNLSRLSY